MEKYYKQLTRLYKPPKWRLTTVWKKPSKQISASLHDTNIKAEKKESKIGHENLQEEIVFTASIWPWKKPSTKSNRPTEELAAKAQHEVQEI